jgi:DNA-binding NarL/FixJ family response regulator
MEPTAAPRAPHDLSAPPIRLVVADDSSKARRAIEAIVERAQGFELVGSAASAEEAIELVGWMRPDLSLLDVRMAGVSGIEAARAISGAWPETVIVLVSALDEDELPTTLRTCGARAFMSKSRLTGRSLAALWSRCCEAETPPVEGWTSGR